MKVETTLFGAGAMFFGPLAIVYGFVTDWHEPVGAAALFLTSGLSGLIALYMFFISRRIDPRPEDDEQAEVWQGSGDQGMFAPYSWWPLPLGLGAAMVFVGLALGWWLFFIGVGVAALALVGWVFEFYRGEHAH